MGIKLNVVYIGPSPFPVGGATTKRKRYMIDYMNEHNIESHYLVCDFKQKGKVVNPIEGSYGKCTYRDITNIANNKKFLTFWKEGKKQLSKWYNPQSKNILIFNTILHWQAYPFYKFAIKKGYHIVFDQVETSMLLSGKSSFLHKINIIVSECLSHGAYKRSAGFVISSALLKDNRDRFPHRKLCLLPNSTPILCSKTKKELNTPLQLLYAGTYAPKDGVSYLINGVIQAKEKGCDCKLILLGKGEEKDMEILELAKDKDYISYLGFVSDEELVQYLLQSDVLCMTRTNSRFANYGFPFKLSEYLATSNIVLATNVGDVSEYVKDKESAFIVEPENSTAIAYAIIDIINNPESALKIAGNGFEVMKMNFSIENVGRRFINFLNKI